MNDSEGGPWQNRLKHEKPESQEIGREPLEIPQGWLRMHTDLGGGEWVVLEAWQGDWPDLLVEWRKSQVQEGGDSESLHWGHSLISRRAKEWERQEQGAGDQTKSTGGRPCRQDMGFA